jgi:hypothetical protein
MSGKKPLTNGSPILNFQQISSQNLSSLIASFAGSYWLLTKNEEQLIHKTKILRFRRRLGA